MGNGAGAKIGRVVQFWDCLQFFCIPGGTYWYSCEDAAGNCKFMVRAQYPTLCNGCHNCLAPTCFNKVFEVEIFMPDRVQQVGMLRAIWPVATFVVCPMRPTLRSNFRKTPPVTTKPFFWAHSFCSSTLTLKRLRTTVKSYYNNIKTFLKP